MMRSMPGPQSDRCTPNGDVDCLRAAPYHPRNSQGPTGGNIRVYSKGVIRSPGDNASPSMQQIHALTGQCPLEEKTMKKMKWSKNDENGAIGNEEADLPCENQLLTRDAKLEQSCFDLKCLHEILDMISLVVDSFPSWTRMWGMIPNFLDSFVGKFLVKKVERYLCSLIEGLLDKSTKRIVETYSYMISSIETYLLALKGIGPSEKHFLNVKVQIENLVVTLSS
ncbi:hypothetical protein M9H77_03311 [Catharanthus roseus]|uniref:Uncharacterized protein n=1 Tax=Catharanthus roseus TaxID=4058 RepID=A0ACC0CBB3_CATRO|nr:hypothetical protein M9H77_03311 [Catharanthus roseus]